MKIRSEGETEFERFDNVMKRILSVSLKKCSADWKPIREATRSQKRKSGNPLRLPLPALLAVLRDVVRTPSFETPAYLSIDRR